MNLKASSAAILMATLVFTFTAKASESANVHDQYLQVENGEFSDTVSKKSTSFSEMNDHERAAVAHSFTNNNQSFPQQEAIKKHQALAGDSEEVVHGTAKTFAQMNEHERAATVQESTNNEGAYAHQQVALNHMKMSAGS